MEPEQWGELFTAWRDWALAVRDNGLNFFENEARVAEALSEGTAAFKAALAPNFETRPYEGSSCAGAALPADYAERLAGALYGRLAGCMLGAPVENWSVNAMRGWAEYLGEPFPPRNYWKRVASPEALHYHTSPREVFERERISFAPADDDTVYTVLNLLLMERYGLNFTTDNVARLWLGLLPFACTAEETALKRLREGYAAEDAADSPYTEWIGAAIRADAFGYVYPGRPDLAAKLAYRDAMLTHRANGVWGEVFFAAVIAAALTATCFEEALSAGLAQIPPECRLSQDIRWAMSRRGSFACFEDARAAVDARFPQMANVHTENNACLVVFSLRDGASFSEIIGDCVAMGLDNDCTAATAGSIAGALYGKSRIEPHWRVPLRGEMRTYLTGYPKVLIDDVITRFARLAERAPR